MEKLPTREELMQAAVQASVAVPLTSGEIARAVQGEHPFFLRFLGLMLRNNADNALHSLSQDLITEEGWRIAIRAQGMALGRTQQVEAIFDLIVEGMNDEEAEPVRNT